MSLIGGSGTGNPQVLPDVPVPVPILYPHPHTHGSHGYGYIAKEEEEEGTTYFGSDRAHSVVPPTGISKIHSVLFCLILSGTPKM